MIDLQLLDQGWINIVGKGAHSQNGVRQPTYHVFNCTVVKGKIGGENLEELYNSS